MPMNDMVGQDIGAPPQNPVPKSTGKPPYQQDPFQEATVTEGTGPAYQTRGVGFRTKPSAYQQDPFETPSPTYKPKYYGDNQELAKEYAPQYVTPPQEDEAPPPVDDQTRLEGYQETGELTPENVPDVYSLTEAELPEYGIDINAPNVGTAPEGIVSGWNDADGDGYDDDGHAMGSHGAVNVQTAAGEQSIEDVLNYADPTKADTIGGAIKGGVERGLDFVEGYAQPKQEDVTFQDRQFTSSPGGAVSLALPGPIGALAAIGGGISKANLERIHAEHGEYSTDTGFGVIPGDSIPNVTTPLAVSPGFIPNTTVISGNTDLAIQQNPGLDVNGDGDLTAGELQEYQAAAEAQKEIERQEQIARENADRIQREAAAAEKRRLEEEHRKALEAQRAGSPASGREASC